MLHPLLKNRKTIIPFLGIWFFIIGVHFITLYFSSGLPLFFCISDSLISGMLYMSVTLILWYPIRFGVRSNQAPLDMIAKNLVLFILSSSSWVLISWGIIYLIYPQWSTYFRESIISNRILTSVILYIASVVIYYAINFYESLQEQQSHEMQLKNLVKEAQLNELRTQLHPHFLFNSLNSINSLTITNPAKAGEMIIKLSEFLRYSLSRKGQEMATLEKELYHIGLYLDIEKVRFGQRLEYISDIEKAPKDWKMPLMILQPLIENAVKHGVYSTDSLVTVKLKAVTEDDYLKITISNNYDPESAPGSGTGTGLSNVRERMRLVYGQDGLFYIKRLNNKFIAELKIPKTN